MLNIQNKFNTPRYLVVKKVIYANTELYFLAAGSFVYEKAIGSIIFLFLQYMNTFF